MFDYRFCSRKKLFSILVRCHIPRGGGKTFRSDYISTVLFYKSRCLKYRIFPFLIPSFEKYVTYNWLAKQRIDDYL